MPDAHVSNKRTVQFAKRVANESSHTRSVGNKAGGQPEHHWLSLSATLYGYQLLRDYVMRHAFIYDPLLDMRYAWATQWHPIACSAPARGPFEPQWS